MKMWLLGILAVLILIAVDITVRIGWDRFTSGIVSLMDEYWPTEQAKPDTVQQPMVGAQSPSEWYKFDIDGFGKKFCEKLHEPLANQIELFRKPPSFYAVKMDDVVEKGIVVQTTMTITHTIENSTLQATYYRGIERCEQALARYKAYEQQERRKLDRYR
jgi:hypothetical protein